MTPVLKCTNTNKIFFECSTLNDGMTVFPKYLLTRHTVLPHNCVCQPKERVPLTDIQAPEQTDHVYPKYNCEIHISSTIPFLIRVGPDSSVDVVTCYGLHGPGNESRWGRDFLRPSIPFLGIIYPPTQRVPGLSRE